METQIVAIGIGAVAALFLFNNTVFQKTAESSGSIKQHPQHMDDKILEEASDLSELMMENVGRDDFAASNKFRTRHSDNTLFQPSTV
jgi:hypothetical protein